MIKRIGVPDGLPVTIGAARQAVRVDHDDDDERITDLIMAETERYEAFTRRLMISAEYEAGFTCWRSCLPLGAGLVREVLAVTYTGVDLIDHDLPDGSWFLTESLAGIAMVHLSPTTVLPELADRPWPVKVRFHGGYLAMGTIGPSAFQMPAADRSNILTMLQRMYDTWEPMTESDMRLRMGHCRAIL